MTAVSIYNIHLTPEQLSVVWNSMMERPAKEVFTTLVAVKLQVDEQENPKPPVPEL